MKVLVLVYVRLYIFKLRKHRLGFYGVFVFAGSSLEDSVIRWCCISYAEQKKCEQWALSIKSDPLVCVRAVSMRDCIEKIKVSHLDCRLLRCLSNSLGHYTS